MFREMARKNKQLTQEECISLLTDLPRGVLSVLGDAGYPYGVPLDHWYNPEDGRIYFHSGNTGHKVDAITRCGKASFCVIERDQFISEEYTNHYRSAIAFGHARILTDEKEIYEASLLWAERLCSSETPQHREETIKKQLPTLGMIVLEIEHVTGKEALDLAKNNYT